MPNTETNAAGAPAKVRKPRPKMSPEDRLLRALNLRGMEEAVALPRAFQQLNGIMMAVKLPFRAKLMTDGSRTLVDRAGKVVFEVTTKMPDCGTHPSLHVAPVHAYSVAADRQGTVEGAFRRLVDQYLVGRGLCNLASVIASSFFKGLWFATPEAEAKLAASAVRQAHLHLRGTTSAALGQAYSVSEGFGQYARRIVSAVPAIANIATHQDLHAAFTENLSALVLVKRLGGDTSLRYLKTPAQPILNKETVGAVTEALAIAAATGEIELPTGTAQRKWLEAVVPYLLLPDEPAPGFKKWLTEKTHLYGGDSQLPAACGAVRLWAAVSHTQRGGWSPALGWRKAQLQAETWAEGQRQQRKAMAKALSKQAVVTVPTVFETRTVDVFALRQLTTEQEIFNAGLELSVCLAVRSSYYFGRAAKGQSAYIGMYEAKVPKGERGGQVEIGKLLAVADVAITAGRPMLVLEFRGHRNATPPQRQRKALEDWLNAERLGAQV